MLVELCGCDHQFDLIAWHHELCESKAGGYRWGNRAGVPKKLCDTMADPKWQKWVSEIQQPDSL